MKRMDTLISPDTQSQRRRSNHPRPCQRMRRKSREWWTGLGSPASQTSLQNNSVNVIGRLPGLARQGWTSWASSCSCPPAPAPPVLLCAAWAGRWFLPLSFFPLLSTSSSLAAGLCTRGSRGTLPPPPSSTSFWEDLLALIFQAWKWGLGFGWGFLLFSD